MVARQDANYKRFIPYLDKQPKVSKAKANGDTPNIIIIDDPDITPEPDMAVSFDLANWAQWIEQPVPRTLDEAIAAHEIAAQAELDRIDAELDAEIDEHEANIETF